MTTRPLQVAAVNAATEDAFPYGADVRVLDPAAGKGAEAAQQEASEAAQVQIPLVAQHFWGFSKFLEPQRS